MAEVNNRIFHIVGIRDAVDVSDKKIVPISEWKDRLYKFSRNKGAVLGLIFIITTIVFSIIGPSFNSYKYDAVNVSHQLFFPRIPGLEKLGIFDGTYKGRNSYTNCPDIYYLFGTDNLGRDQWTRVFMGTRISLFVAFMAVLIDITIGIVIGVICGYYGGWLDITVQRILEIVQGIPTVIVVTLLMMVMKPGLTTITIALCFSGWINMSHLVRAQVIKLKENEFVLAAKTMGESDFKIIFREILPNVVGQIIVMAMMSVPQAIFFEAYLSFLGLGIPDPMASLGSLINNGFSYMLLYPYMVLIPVVLFVILMISFNLVADGLRDAFDATIGGV